jgi:hypothetical protein
MTTTATPTLPAHVAFTFDLLTRQGQDPQHEDTHDGCFVISASHRGRPGRFRIYLAPGGSWTHSADRAAQLAERFPAR